MVQSTTSCYPTSNKVKTTEENGNKKLVVLPRRSLWRRLWRLRRKRLRRRCRRLASTVRSRIDSKHITRFPPRRWRRAQPLRVHSEVDIFILEEPLPSPTSRHWIAANPRCANICAGRRVVSTRVYAIWNVVSICRPNVLYAARWNEYAKGRYVCVFSSISFFAFFSWWRCRYARRHERERAVRSCKRIMSTDIFSCNATSTQRGLVKSKPTSFVRGIPISYSLKQPRLPTRFACGPSQRYRQWGRDVLLLLSF